MTSASWTPVFIAAAAFVPVSIHSTLRFVAFGRIAIFTYQRLIYDSLTHQRADGAASWIKGGMKHQIRLVVAALLLECGCLVGTLGLASIP